MFGPSNQHKISLFRSFLALYGSILVSIVSVNPLKNSDVLISERREGVKQDAKMSLFLCPYYGGKEGVKANKSNVWKASLNYLM